MAKHSHVFFPKDQNVNYKKAIGDYVRAVEASQSSAAGAGGRGGKAGSAAADVRFLDIHD